MTNEDKILKIIKESIREEIKISVNGKIDAMREDLKNHMEEIKPFMEGMQALKFGRKFIYGLSGIILAIGSVILMIKKLW